MNTAVIKAVESDCAQKTFTPPRSRWQKSCLMGSSGTWLTVFLNPAPERATLPCTPRKKMYYASHNYPTHDERSIREAVEEADIDCIEIDALLRNTLEGRGFRVIHDDFLSFQTQKRYSLIVMNPPFDRGLTIS